MRLDKFLALSGERSRSEAVSAVRGGLVRVNNLLMRDPSANVAEADAVTLRDQAIADNANQYFMLHKPAGVLTAARDRNATTVMDLLPAALSKRKVLPVGRLDKDTTGLLVLTNDGALAHFLLSPKRHVWKEYLATVEGKLSVADVSAFEDGMSLSDFVAKPATLRILSANDEQSQALVELREGKFHQVKRMFASLGHEVLTLHRSAFGPLTLPPDLALGDYRALTGAEITALKQAIQNSSADAEEGQNDA